MAGGPKLEDVRVLSANGCGTDGASYRVEEDATGRLLELHTLAGARAVPGRFDWLSRHLRVLALVENSRVRRLVGTDLDSERPWVLLEAAAGPPVTDRILAGPTGPLDLVNMAVQMALAVEGAHRLGAYTGSLAPDSICEERSERLLLNLSGIDAGRGRSSPGLLRHLFVAPELDEHEPGPASDVFSLGMILACLWAGRLPDAPGRRPAGAAGDARIEVLIDSMIDLDPEARPDALKVIRKCVSYCRRGGSSSRLPVVPCEGREAEPRGDVGPPGPRRLGRFEVTGPIGQGGTSEVFSGIDPTDGSAVAIKVLKAASRNTGFLHEFRREARILQTIRSPRIANLVEANVDGGRHYIVMEMVQGPSLKEIMRECGKIGERTALEIAADVARALVDVHRAGVVHRDIKPANIIVTDGDPRRAEEGSRCRVKLVDFGIARSLDPLDFTRSQAENLLAGTPLYMSPEQCRGEAVGPPSDVYALGATLFHMISGRPPFTARTSADVLRKHTAESPPRLEDAQPSVGAATAALVARALQKEPVLRFADAAQLLEVLEGPGALPAAPDRPRPVPGAGKSKEFRFEFTLRSSATQLWPYVSDTNRVNHAAGLPPVDYTPAVAGDPDAGHAGEMRLGLLRIRWRERPFEWVEPSRYSVVREFENGPLHWYSSEVVLEPLAGGGTRLVQRLTASPRWWVGGLVAWFQMAFKFGRAIRWLYPQIDRTIQETRGGFSSPGAPFDPYQVGSPVSKASQEQLGSAASRMREAGVEPGALAAVLDYVRHASVQSIERIRPLELARLLDLDAGQVVEVCLRAARLGVLQVLWDILCPVCRVPSERRESLRDLVEEGRCGVCGIDFDLAAEEAVELILRVDPSIRKSEARTYCIGNPGLSPHVVSQLRLEPDERSTLNLRLEDGAYLLRGPERPVVFDFTVGGRGRASRVDVEIHDQGLVPADLPDRLKPSYQVVSLHNCTASAVTMRLERRAGRVDALTAARACGSRLFTRLFPEQSLPPGRRLRAVGRTLMAATLAGSGIPDGGPRAAAAVRRLGELVDELVSGAGERFAPPGGQFLALLDEPAVAVRRGWRMLEGALGDPDLENAGVKISLHLGTVLISRPDDMDFGCAGADVAHVVWLLSDAPVGGMALSRAVAEDPEVSAVIEERGGGRVVPLSQPRPGLEWAVVVGAG